MSSRVLPQVGLDAAGKTTILYKLKLGEIVTTIPTIGGVISPSIAILSFLTCSNSLAQDSMLRQWSTKISASLFGMLVAKTR
jgi:hypothetical protein